MAVEEEDVKTNVVISRVADFVFIVLLGGGGGWGVGNLFPVNTFGAFSFTPTPISTPQSPGLRCLMDDYYRC